MTGNDEGRQEPLTDAELADGLADLLASVLADNADAILLLDPSGTVEVANRAATELFDRDEDELVGQMFGFPVAEAGFTEIEILRRDGRPLVVEMHVSETRWADRPVRVATLRDVTSRVEASNALRDFVSMASHEFRTPLTAIGGFASTLVDNVENLDHDDVRRYAGIIVEQADRLSRLANDLLAMSRLDSGELPVYAEDVSLERAVSHAIASIAPNIVVTKDIPSGLRVRTDADHLRDILTNYVANAVKYGREPFDVSATVDGDFVVVRVSDVGAGVPEDFVPRLFERFARARNENTRSQIGTGLGLAIVRGLAQLHGGDAWYEPNDPVGSRFCVSVPLSPGGGEVPPGTGAGT